MEYELRHFDETLLRFEANKDSSDPGYRILWVNDDSKPILPYGLDPTAESLARWVSHRAIPKNRAFVNTFLARISYWSDRVRRSL